MDKEVVLVLTRPNGHKETKMVNTRECGDKIRFRSHDSALNFIGAKFRTLRLPDLHVYLCSQCGRHHIGHKKIS